MKKYIGLAINGSLKRLKTDYIDFINFIGLKDLQIVLEEEITYHREDEREWNNFESILQALEKFIKREK